MGPSLIAGDWLLVDPDAYRRRAPRPGDIVVVPDPREPGRLLVKRVGRVFVDHVEILGDVPQASTDSRTFGPVETATVVGRAWARYWPPRRVGPVR